MQMEQLTNEKLEVEFFLSVDDFVHIALKVNSSVQPNTLTTYAYYFFLISNVILFPVFLWLGDYFVLGAIVFALNVAAVTYLIPKLNADGYREYYRQLIGDREDHPATVELSVEGINYVADEGQCFWPWKRITEIEETPESIYFYFEGNGIAVRKTGFAYFEQQEVFTRFARHQLENHRPREIGA